MSTYVKETFNNGLYRVKYISGMKASESANSSYHSNGKLLFLYYIKGGGSIIIDKTRYDISDGDVFVIKPTEFFRQNIDDNCFHSRIALIIYPDMFKKLPDNYYSILLPFLKKKNGEKNSISYRIVNEIHLNKQFEDLLGYLEKDSEIERVLAFSKVLEILVATNKIITEEHKSDDGNTVRSSRVDDILKYLNSNYTKNISITDVANHFNLDRAYISRLFKNKIGMAIWDYVIMRRIYMFNFLINDSDSLEETAYRVGFKNYSNFYRLYKKYMQMTPTEYKRTLLDYDNA